MSSRPKEIQIIPGGLNLAAPGDAIPDGDCLDLSGFFPGSVGMLEQAGGWTLASGTHSGAGFHSLCQTAGRLYFGGSMGSLWRGTGTGSETMIDSGFDGYPLGILAFQGYVWITNRSKQSRDNGTTVGPWTPPPPGLPTLSNLPVPPLSPVPTVFEADPAGQPSPTANWTQIRMFTPSSTDALEVGNLVTIAGITTPNATAMNGTWVVEQISAGAPNSLVILTANLPPSTVPTAAGATGMTWTFTSGNQPFGEHKYWITWQYQDLGESNPSSTGTPPVITPATITVTAAGTLNDIDISALLPPPPGVIGWNIYRQSPDMASPYRLNEFVLDITRTFVWDYGDAVHRHDSDYLVNGLGILMQGDHDPAPSARIMANQVYNGRIVVASSAANPNRVWYTPPLQPAFFRGSGNPQSGDWVDVGTDRDDAILFMAVKPGQIVFYRQKSIWRLTGDFQDASSRIDPVVPDLGCTGPRAVVCTSLGDYFRGPEGVYKYNGDWAQKMSTKLDPVFRLADRPENFPLEDPTRTVNSALGFHAGRLWCSYTILGQTYNSREFIMHVDTGRWFSRTLGIGAFLDAGPMGFLGAANDAIRNLETGFTDGGSLTPMSFQTSYQNCGLPDREKTFSDLVITHNTGGQQLAIWARTNKLQRTTDTFRLDATLLSTAPTRSIFPLIYPSNYIGPDGTGALVGLPIRAFSLAIRLEGNGVNGIPDLSIETPIILHYYLEARAGQVFDSDETDHGMPAVVKFIDMVEFDIDNSLASAKLQIYSDVPGGVMAPRLTAGVGLTIPQTIGRQAVRLVLPHIIEGKLLRYVVALPYTVSPTADFNLYGIRARVTPIGVYCDGSIMEYFDTRPIPIGV